MTKEELKSALEGLIPVEGEAVSGAAADGDSPKGAGADGAAVFEEGAEWLTMKIASGDWSTYARLLRHTPGLSFDYLFCVTGVDWRTHFTMVYHLTSTVHRQVLVVKARLDHDHPVIDTVSDIWRTAEFHEREVYDLMGVIFTGHPDLRRLFMTDDWKGWPLRKDYEDPINMIKL
ncbi:MAG: NADH-quinone oxidoreductase subunit C [Bacteroidota bacterium]|nr:NADH-quinone oxidoreductase subunit C [Bacteroidota bacterium]